MADEEIATRAPESDAQETEQPAPSTTSIIPGDSKVDQGAASMGEHCTTDRPTPSGAQPTGSLEMFGDVETYVAKPADYPHTPAKLLLLLTGGTGIHSTNNQLQADKWASEGYVVVMPDQFSGYPAPASTTTTTDIPATPSTESAPSYIEQLKLTLATGLATLAKSYTLDMWLAYHTPTRVLPILHRAITAIKSAFPEPLSHGDGLYAVGYCFGAKYVLLLGATLPDDVVHGQGEPGQEPEAGMVTRAPEIKVGAIAHGTQITVADLAGVEVPLGVVAVEDDGLFPDEVREEGVVKLKENGVECAVQVYPGVPHGFAVLGDYEDEGIKTKQGEAFEQMVGWLKAH